MFKKNKLNKPGLEEMTRVSDRDGGRGCTDAKLWLLVQPTFATFYTEKGSIRKQSKKVEKKRTIIVL